MAANGNVMDRVPEPLRKLMGNGTAVAMADRFDMNEMLLALAAQQQQGHQAGAAQINYQPFDFRESGSAGLEIRQARFPIEALERATGADQVHPAVRAQLEAIFQQIMAQPSI